MGKSTKAKAKSTTKAQTPTGKTARDPRWDDIFTKRAATKAAEHAAARKARPAKKAAKK